MSTVSELVTVGNCWQTRHSWPENERQGASASGTEAVANLAQVSFQVAETAARRFLSLPYTCGKSKAQRVDAQHAPVTHHEDLHHRRLQDGCTEGTLKLTEKRYSLRVCIL